MRALAGLAVAAFGFPGAASALTLGQPIACTLGVTCFIQNYTDDDPGPGAQDFTCGPLTYNGHKGTDFALPTRAAMRAGVAVLAAAPGTVIATRDGMADIAADAPDAPDIKGRECGNGVLIDNGDGWQTQYCHMKRDSLSVHKGDRVALGARLGEVGLSGDTVFPHLHVTLRHAGQVVDPFAPEAAQPPATCATAAPHQMWAPPIAYVPGGLIDIGIATGMPDFDQVKGGLPTPPELPGSAPALVVWAHAYGARSGDRLQITLQGPGRLEVLSNTIPLPRTQARLFRALGKREPAGGWPVGDYRATVRMLRGASVLGLKTIAITIAR